jgi:hypothetical protein
MGVIEPLISHCLFMVSIKSRPRYHGSRRAPHISVFIHGEFKIYTEILWASSNPSYIMVNLKFRRRYYGGRRTPQISVLNLKYRPRYRYMGIVEPLIFHCLFMVNL